MLRLISCNASNSFDTYMDKRVERFIGKLGLEIIVRTCRKAGRKPIHLPVEFHHTLFTTVRNCTVPPEDLLLSLHQTHTMPEKVSSLPSIHPALCQPIAEINLVFTSLSNCFFSVGF